ncbi:MAG: prolipoprotein diacylglyceryl transferase [Patescibacteria group bacterium]|nr:prolipoprotein diacylglyceryl transferase [Patescibacteria group bacterium]
MNFLHHFLPSPILISLGPLQIHWYGLFVVTGVIVGLIVVSVLGRRFNITTDEIFNLGFYLIIFGLIGARLYAVGLAWPYYFANPAEIIAVWHGGLAIHGGIIAGLITLIIYSHKKAITFWQWTDLIAPAIALGQGIGRWGNYFNQELFGGPTNLPWGIPISPLNRPSQFIASQYFHPTFLYESILDVLNFLILIWLFSTKPKTKGIIFGVYLFNFGVIRILMELLRTDETPILFGWRLPIVVSIVIIIFAITLMIYLNSRRNQSRV